MKALLFTYILILLTIAGYAQKKTKQDTTVYNAVEINPQFPGGEEALKKFLMAHLHFPEKDKDDIANNSRLYFQFIVESNGSLTNFKFIKGSKSIFNQLVLDLKKGPKWNPGYLNGKKVRTLNVVPISCILLSE